jgi:hypothetical protein
MSYTKRDLETFFDTFVETALACSDDAPDGDPLDENYTAADLAPKTEDALVADCKRFLDRAWPLIEAAPRTIGFGNLSKLEQAAHDFFVIRTGGRVSTVWPRRTGEQIESLARRFGDVFLVPNDDGKIYDES